MYYINICKKLARNITSAGYNNNAARKRRGDAACAAAYGERVRASKNKVLLHSAAETARQLVIASFNKFDETSYPYPRFHAAQWLPVIAPADPDSSRFD